MTTPFRDSKKCAREYDQCKMKLQQLTREASQCRARMKELEPFVVKVLERVNNNEPFQTIGKKGDQVSKPLLLDSQHVAQLRRFQKRRALSIKSLPEVFRAWFRTNNHLSATHVDEFMEFTKNYLQTTGDHVVRVKYRKLRKAEMPQPFAAPEKTSGVKRKRTDGEQLEDGSENAQDEEEVDEDSADEDERDANIDQPLVL